MKIRVEASYRVLQILNAFRYTNFTLTATTLIRQW